MEKGRAEAFSDGVFAVAITVLVFNLLTIGTDPKVPLTYRLLGHSWPAYAAYVVGFLTIGIMWLNHHTMLAHVVTVDRVTLVLNIFLLLGVVLMPWPTALVANHLTSSGAHSGQVAAVVYGIGSVLISVGFSLLWAYLSTHQEPLAALTFQARRTAGLRFSAGLVGYVAGILVAAFVSATAALVIYGLVAVYYLFEHLPAVAPADDPADAGG